MGPAATAGHLSSWHLQPAARLPVFSLRPPVFSFRRRLRSSEFRRRRGRRLLYITLTDSYNIRTTIRSHQYRQTWRPATGPLACPYACAYVNVSEHACVCVCTLTFPVFVGSPNGYNETAHDVNERGAREKWCPRPIEVKQLP